jgi:hypothetical protein
MDYEPDEPEVNIPLDEWSFENALQNIATGMKAIGLDPDSLLKCTEHNEFMFDPDNHFEPTEHFQHHVGDNQ